MSVPDQLADATDTPVAISVDGHDDNDTRYFNRELSWLSFNARVLQLAGDPATPLLEQLGFLAIHASNLDEFFQVRVAGLHDQVAAGITRRTPDERSPMDQLTEIRTAVERQLDRHERCYLDEVRPQLAVNGIELLDWDDLEQTERDGLSVRFRQRIFPVLTPLAVDPGHPFPYISDLSLNLAVRLRDSSDERDLFARVKIPPTLDRWVRIDDRARFVPLEQVIAAHLDQLFPGTQILESHAFRVTRNADLTLEDEEADDLLAAVEMELRRRRFGRAARLEVASDISDEVLDLLTRELDVMAADVYRCAGPLDPKSLFAVASLDRPELRWPEWRSITEPALDGDDDTVNFFDVLRKADVLAHHPYASFGSSVVEFVHQASLDPSVLAIKLTLYRTSGDSPIIDALIAAAERGKQVAVLVELKARFDEAANIGWAKRLEQAGVHVAYGLAGLKIHTKVVMVVREEPDGVRRYCHVGTGNYNNRTARVYEDLGLLTSSPALGSDLSDLFNSLTGYGRSIEYQRLLVAPEHLRNAMYRLIDTEVESGRGRIIMKMNSLVDQGMIEKLYAASCEGVDIDLIVRGICCLRPGVPGMSDRIKVRSIVGRYLEHSRIYHFANAGGIGQGCSFIGSADLMGRNLDRRVEALVPVEDPTLEGRLAEFLQVELTDDRLAWTLAGDGTWTKRHGPAGIDTHVRMQQMAGASASV